LSRLLEPLGTKAILVTGLMLAHGIIMSVLSIILGAGLL
jgi:hypothetical protein